MTVSIIKFLYVFDILKIFLIQYSNLSYVNLGEFISL